MIIKKTGILKVRNGSSDPWTVLPDPAKGGLTVDISDVDASSSGRNQFGDMIRDRVATKTKVSCSFPPLPPAEMSILLNAIQAEEFYLEYPDPFTGTRKTILVYVGDRSAPLYWALEDGTWLWESLSVNFIEV